MTAETKRLVLMHLLLEAKEFLDKNWEGYVHYLKQKTEKVIEEKEAKTIASVETAEAAETSSEEAISSDFFERPSRVIEVEVSETPCEETISSNFLWKPSQVIEEKKAKTTPSVETAEGAETLSEEAMSSDILELSSKMFEERQVLPESCQRALKENAQDHLPEDDLAKIVSDCAGLGFGEVEKTFHGLLSILNAPSRQV